jgi:hypothetical protein
MATYTFRSQNSLFNQFLVDKQHGSQPQGMPAQIAQCDVMLDRFRTAQVTVSVQTSSLPVCEKVG